MTGLARRAGPNPEGDVKKRERGLGGAVKALSWSAVIKGAAAAPIMVMTALLAGRPKGVGRFTLTIGFRWSGGVAKLHHLTRRAHDERPCECPPDAHGSTDPAPVPGGASSGLGQGDGRGLSRRVGREITRDLTERRQSRGKSAPHWDRAAIGS